MKLKNPMIIVTDLENSKKFYKEVLGLRVIMDFGANITLTGGLCLQTKDSWLEFINASDKDISFGGNDAEIYFEEDDFDKFTERLSKLEIDYFIRYTSIGGDRELSVFMTLINILLRLEKI